MLTCRSRWQSETELASELWNSDRTVNRSVIDFIATAAPPGEKDDLVDFLLSMIEDMDARGEGRNSIAREILKCTFGDDIVHREVLKVKDEYLDEKSDRPSTSHTHAVGSKPDSLPEASGPESRLESPRPNPPAVVVTQAVENRSSWLIEWKQLRKVDKISLSLGLLSLVFAVPVFLDWFSEAKSAPAILLLGQNAALILFLIALVSRSYSRSTQFEARWYSAERRLKSIIETMCYLFHDASHVKRDMLNNQRFAPRELNEDAAVRSLVYFCDDLVLAFNAIFHEHPIMFDVAIKALIDEEEVVVLARNRINTTVNSYRLNNRMRHRIGDNTAFRELLLKDKVVFASDDLVNDSRRYESTSREWQERYNATMVVPIRRDNVGENDVFELVGYIGVDCKIPDGVKHVFCDGNNKWREDFANLLLAYADSAFGIIKRGKIAEASSNTAELSLKQYVTDQANFAFVEKLHRCFVKSYP